MADYDAALTSSDEEARSQGEVLRNSTNFPTLAAA